MTGVDRSPGAIASATAAAASRGLPNVRFVLADLDELAETEPFDAILGRYVLQWLPDPAETLRALARHGRSGAIVVFHEVDWGGSLSHPPAPLWDATCRWVSETVRRSGAEIRGTTMQATFKRAGLGAPTMRIEAVAGDEEHTETIDLLVSIARNVVRAAESEGIATAREVDIETLGERLRLEAATLHGVFIAHNEVGAWVRLS